MKTLINAALTIQVFLICCSANNEKKAASQTDPVSQQTFTNPLLPSGADPWAIFHEGTYYYIKSENDKLVLMRTPDITDLKNAEKKTVWTPPAGKAHSKNLWAPEIHYIGDKWYIYYAADDGNHLNHRIFVLENSNPDPFAGEFKMKARIKTDEADNWAIDGTVFMHNNSLYFVWSGWQSPKVDTETACIYIARMSDPWTISSDRILLSKPELEWERKYDYPATMSPRFPIYVNEGPQLLEHGSKLHLVYSASGCWTPYYALGMLTADEDADLLDPAAWVKSPKPVFQQSIENGVYATGHNSFFKSPDGQEDWLFYHANDTPDGGCDESRSPRIQKINWRADGTPDFGKPVSTSVKLQKPSGTVD